MHPRAGRPGRGVFRQCGMRQRTDGSVFCTEHVCGCCMCCVCSPVKTLIVFPAQSILLTSNGSSSVYTMRLPSAGDLRQAAAHTNMSGKACKPTLDLGCKDLWLHWKPIQKATSLVSCFGAACLAYAMRMPALGRVLMMHLINQRSSTQSCCKQLWCICFVQAMLAAWPECLSLLKGVPVMLRPCQHVSAN